MLFNSLKTIQFCFLNPLLQEKNQFSSVAHLCPAPCDPIDCSTPGFPVHLQLLEPTQTHVHCIQPQFKRKSVLKNDQYFEKILFPISSAGILLCGLNNLKRTKEENSVSCPINQQQIRIGVIKKTDYLLTITIYTPCTLYLQKLIYL